MLALAHRSAPRRLRILNLRPHLSSNSSAPSFTVRRFADSSLIAQDEEPEEWQPDPHHKWKKYEYGRTKNKKSGKSFERKTASLPVTRMGKHAKVLILQSVEEDPEEAPLEKQEAKVAVYQANSTSIDIVSDIIETPSSTGDDIENALATIDAMRPDESRQNGSAVLPQTQMLELARELHIQFSLPQLKEYAIRNHQLTTQNEVTDSLLEQPLIKPWLWDRTALAVQAGVQVTNSKQGQKATATSTILEQIWKLKSDSDTEGVCSAVRIISRPVQNLLTAGTPSALDELSTMFGVKYRTVFRKVLQNYRLVLTAPKGSVVLAANHLQSLLEQSHGSAQQISITRLQKPSRQWPERAMTDCIDIDASDIQQITQQTAAVLDLITPDPNQHSKKATTSLAIAGITPDKILAAKQAVMPLVLYRKASSKVSMCANAIEDEVELVKTPAALPPQIPSPYHKFSQKRLVGIKPLDSSFQNQDRDVDWIYNEVHRIMEQNNEVDSISQREANEDWIGPVEHSTSVSTGYFLHCDTPSAIVTQTVLEKNRVPAVITDPIKSHFLSNVPNGFHFFRKLNYDEERVKRTIKVKVQLVPDLLVKHDVSLEAPDIELTFALNTREPGPARLQKAGAWISSNSHHVMLPNAPVDLAFRTASMKMLNLQSPRNSSNAEFSAFVEKVSRKLKLGQPIRDVPGFTMEIPASLMNKSQKKLSVPYIISDVHQRETISFQVSDDTVEEKAKIFPSYPASYSVITAGLPAYTTTQLTLHTPFTDEIKGENGHVVEVEQNMQDAGKEFVRTALWMVNKLGQAQSKADMKTQPKVDKLGIR